MNAGTGVVSLFLALGALLVSAANSKTAEARPSYTNLHAFKARATGDVAGAASVAPAISTAPPAAATSVERITPPHLLENRGLRRLRKAETSPAMLQVAASIVKRHYAKATGTEITVDVEGKQIVARIERHFHPEGGAVKPWGFHPGVSLFVKR
jgi:hypothetical protein